MSKRKVGKLEKQARRVKVEEMLVQGHTEYQIAKRLAEEWNCTTANVKYYIHEVKREWQNRSPEEKSYLRNKYHRRLEGMFLDAQTAGNYKIALEIQKELNRLSGLHNETKEDEHKVEVLTISEADQSATEVPNASEDREEDASGTEG